MQFLCTSVRYLGSLSSLYFKVQYIQTLVFFETTLYRRKVLQLGSKPVHSIAASFASVAVVGFVVVASVVVFIAVTCHHPAAATTVVVFAAATVAVSPPPLLNRGDIAVQRTANGLGESRSSCSR